MEITGGDINGAGLVAMLLLSVSVPATMGAKPKGAIKYLGGFILGVLLLVGLISTQIHPKALTQPYTQIAVVTFAITVSFISLPRMLLQLVMLIVMLPPGVFLCYQYHTLVEMDQFTGDPSSVKAINEAYEATLLAEVLGELKGAEGERQGFLLAIPLGEGLSDGLKEELRDSARLEPRSEWHTPLTGIYENWVKPTGLFYPGIAKGGAAEMTFSALDSKVERVPDFKSHRKRGPLLSTKSVYQ